MGGKGGLNILPQKKWNVYNWDNRIKVMENEKIVEKEIQKLEKNRKEKNLSDKVKILKSYGDKEIAMEKYNFNSSQEKIDKNKIFKEVMERRSMGKKLNVEMSFDKMTKPMKSDDQLKFFDNKEAEKKYFKIDDNEVDQNIKSEIQNITFKDSIKNNLNPWYCKKRKEDYELYRNQILNANKSEIECDKILGKKHNLLRDHNTTSYHIKQKNSANIDKDVKTPKEKISNKNNKSIEELRKERIQREQREREKINLFLQNKQI